ncbi:MAG TPA: Holliday junction resolvase RuvX [Candidatus Acidoferrales bacterium]|nr:Holliday junction resolvase RuvX [Candidatus Acidoferrales bacterium]
MASPHPISRVSSSSKSGRILAIDYGRRRIGLAVSDELGITAAPLATLERKNRRDDIRRLRDTARKYTITLIIVGSPVHLDGHAGEMAEETAGFAARIQKELGLPVKLRDERLTTWEAEQTLKETAGHKRKNANVDSVAAAILLREYLDENPRRESAKDVD